MPVDAISNADHDVVSNFEEANAGKVVRCRARRSDDNYGNGNEEHDRGRRPAIRQGDRRRSRSVLLTEDFVEYELERPRLEQTKCDSKKQRRE